MRGRSPSCPSAGLRRVAWVVVTVDGSGVHATAGGVTHRLPRTVPITMREAHRLVAEGVPVVVRRAA
ncbi:MAG TPA: hypothetical protein VGB14_18665 [Acidimicrobiales bacterium]|jgi:hypothetical protein